jgi:hypothetical protein
MGAIISLFGWQIMGDRGDRGRFSAAWDRVLAEARKNGMACRTGRKQKIKSAKSGLEN